VFEFEREEEFTSGVVKKVLNMKSIICVLLLPLIVAGWGQKYEKIRLRDVQVLTLRAGEMTTGRRSSPVPQLSCVGGSGAGRGWEPQVVQCYNRGWDGRDVQWECKADMEGTVRFGKVEVICEGYDYAEDDYILAGSCGLEYTLELTREGKQQNSYSGSGGGGWFSNQKSNSYSNYGYDASQSTSGLSDLIIIVVACILIYAFYKTCIDSNSLQDTQYSSTNDDYSGGYPGAGGWADPNRGTSNNYGAGSGGYYGGSSDTCGRRQRGTGAGGFGGGGGGFWTGAATGGLLGYMFGNRGNTGYRNYGGYNRGWGWGGGGYNRGFTGGSFTTGGGGGSSSSSGTRTASGFGGTRRR